MGSLYNNMSTSFALFPFNFCIEFNNVNLFNNVNNSLLKNFLVHSLSTVSTTVAQNFPKVDVRPSRNRFVTSLICQSTFFEDIWAQLTVGYRRDFDFIHRGSGSPCLRTCLAIPLPTSAVASNPLSSPISPPKKSFFIRSSMTVSSHCHTWTFSKPATNVTLS